MAKEMLINVSEGEECRIALLDGGKLEELYMERTSSTSHVGNIYKGRVTNVEPSIQAAFVDFGLGRNGFLHISDLMPTYFGRKGEDIVETVGKKMARRDRPPIQRCLRRGDDIVVQIIKEGIGTKGPTLSTYLSVPGRILVMMPGMSSKGVSRKIEDEVERRRLRQILDQLDPPDDCGFIIRTAGVGKSKADIERDLKYLARLWENLKKVRDHEPAPVELYTEGDLVTRTVRDLFSADVDRIVVDSAAVAKRVKDVIKLSSPRTKDRVEVYDDTIPLFHKYGIEREIELMYSRHVPLPSGGSLVIDSTEAVVAIDVNSGKFRDHSDAEMTAFKTDIEAADEIARQLRLRDLGGVIICDFIDLRYERHRRELEERLHNHLKRDRAKTKMLRMSQFGIIEMTRQRMRPSFKRSVYFDCPHCKGAGLVKTPESMSLDVMRRLAIAVSDQRVHRVELAISPDVGMYLLNKKRAALAALEAEAKKRIIVRQDPSLALDEIKLDLFDLRDGLVMIEELAALMTAPPHRTQLTTRQHGQGRGGPQGGRFDSRRQAAENRRPPSGGQRGGGGRGRGGQGRSDEDEMPEAEERYEMASAAFEDQGDEQADDRGQREERDQGDDRELGGESGGADREEAISSGEGTDEGDSGEEVAGADARQDRQDRPARDDRHNRGGGRQQQGGDRGRDQQRDQRGGGRGDRDFAGAGSGANARGDRPGRGDQGARGNDRPGNERSGNTGRGGEQQGGRGDQRGGGGGRDQRVRDDQRPRDDRQQRDDRPQRDDRHPRDGRPDRGQPQHAGNAAGRNGGPQDRGAAPGQPQHRNGEPADATAGGDEQGGGGRRRRRRRRGRRGRGRGQGEGNGNGAPGMPQPAHADDGRGGDDSSDDRADQGAPGAQRAYDDYGADDDRADRGAESDRQDRDDESRADATPTGAEGDANAVGAAGSERDRDESRFDGARQTADEQGGVNEAAGAVDVTAAEDTPEADVPAGKARGGRSRGGRGRSRGGKGRTKAAAEEVPEAKAAESASEAAEGAPAAKPKRGSRARGTRAAAGTARGRGKKTKATAADESPEPAGETPSGAASASGSASPSPGVEPSAAVVPPSAIRRTGSTDRHLIRNEADETPVMHEPVRRPRSVRDLDHIPDDLD